MTGEGKVRLDSWLWAARFFKTRSLAAAAIDGGRVEVNGESAKRSKAIRIGDQVALRQGPYHHHLEVTGLAERRGPASVAATLYRETPESIAGRQAVAERLRVQNPVFYDGAGRPTKKQRRAIDRWKGKD
ncbi:MAG: RNA-binding S4 domain-containing protein [Gemmatimonadetes bacterium]|nr:RNA-binding S4 domain-containing protein [Gemmatimonadota bacterium]